MHGLSILLLLLCLSPRPSPVRAMQLKVVLTNCVSSLCLGSRRPS